MKKTIHTTFAVIGLVVITTLLSCNKDIEQPQLSPYVPEKLDANGGQWKGFVIENFNDLEVPAPPADLAGEIAELKAAQANLTAAQQERIQYWGVGAVIRWQQIARNLLAKYNLPPASLPDGTYPSPDPQNPTKDPKFPFANPPYASRALAYLSVAQYDALIAAWHYKYLYNTPRPGQVDASVQSHLPVYDLPSYPSEAAVVATASAEILRAMFPGEVDYINQLVAEHQEADRQSGRSLPVAVTEGAALGRKVGGKVMDRARTDGMGQANNQSLVPGLITDAQSRGITPVWGSLDKPSRPPMLPNFGNVKTWNFGHAELVALRLPAPPAIGSPEFNQDMEELRNYATNLTREQHRIATFWADGPGSYTPPGHWNRRAGDLIYDYKQSEIRAARTMALINTAMMDAGISCWDVKYYYYYPRPHQMDAKVRTVVGTPNFPAYTSGHSTFSGAAAEVLSYIFPAETEKMKAWATEASVSRIYGCIHYRFDCEKGLTNGYRIGAYAVERGTSDGSSD